MTATEFSSISLLNHRFFQRYHPVFASNRLGHRRFGPFWASKGLNARLSEVHKPLQVVAGRHHRHRKVCPRLTDGAHQLAAHLRHRAEHVLDPGTYLGDALVTSLLALGQRFVALALTLDLIAKALFLQPGFAPLGRIAPVSIDIAACIERIKDRLKMLAVMRTGRVRLDRADELVLFVHVDRQLVTKVAFAVLLGPGRIQILLTTLGRLPVGRHGALVNQGLFLATVMLPSSRHQRGVNDLTTPGNESLLEQPSCNSLEQRLGVRLAPWPRLSRWIP